MAARIQAGSRRRFSGPNARSSATVRPMIWVSGFWNTSALLSTYADPGATVWPATDTLPLNSPAGTRPFRHKHNVREVQPARDDDGVNDRTDDDRPQVVAGYRGGNLEVRRPDHLVR